MNHIGHNGHKEIVDACSPSGLKCFPDTPTLSPTGRNRLRGKPVEATLVARSHATWARNLRDLLNLDEAHAAVSSNRELMVIAESGYIDANVLTSLCQGD